MEKVKQPLLKKNSENFLVPFILVTCCFALWGFANDITNPMVKAFSKVIERELPYKIIGRRAGDIAACYADPSLAESELGFKARYDLERMCRDSWNFQQKNM